MYALILFISDTSLPDSKSLEILRILFIEGPSFLGFFLVGGGHFDIWGGGTNPNENQGVYHYY